MSWIWPHLDGFWREIWMCSRILTVFGQIRPYKYGQIQIYGQKPWDSARFPVHFFASPFFLDGDTVCKIDRLYLDLPTLCHTSGGSWKRSRTRRGEQTTESVSACVSQKWPRLLPAVSVARYIIREGPPAVWPPLTPMPPHRHRPDVLQLEKTVAVNHSVCPSVGDVQKSGP